MFRKTVEVLTLRLGLGLLLLLLPHPPSKMSSGF